MKTSNQQLKQQLLASSIVILAALPQFALAKNHQENDGVVVIEAEHFSSQHLSQQRRWFKVTAQNNAHLYQDSDPLHLSDASAGGYIEILPDTRTNHFEKIVKGENFTDKPGQVAVLSYPTYFANAGTYYVWVRAYSTGSEDNGVHIGLNGQWPDTASRVQLCKGKHKWTWSSAQRTKQNHCGKPNSITLKVPSVGVHNIMVSMREDGFELDKLLLTKNPEYVPVGQDLPEKITINSDLPEKEILHQLSGYQRILLAGHDFKNTSKIPFYHHQKKQALAINAVKVEYRDQFAYAEYKIDKKDSKSTSLTLVTLAEIDGESEYEIYLNEDLIAEFTNPETEIDYQEQYFTVSNVTLKTGDIIRVGSKAVTNGKIPENGGTAYARGRWRALVLGASVQPL